MCSELGERGRRNAHDHGQMCSCAPEVYRRSVHALYVYIATSYAVEQNLQPVIIVARMWGASITSCSTTQRFLSAYGPIAQHFRPRRHLMSASRYREEMHNRRASWADITGTERAA